MEEQLTPRRGARATRSFVPEPGAAAGPGRPADQLGRRPASARLLRLTVVAAFLAIPVISGVSQMRGVAFRDHLDVFALEMTTPVLFVLPLIAVAFTGLGLAHELDKRFAMLVRTRRSPRSYLTSRILRAAAGGFTLLFLFSALPFVMAFVVWPALGDPGIDPGLYGETAASAAREAPGRFSYSQVVALGPWAFGLLYSAWAGLAGATFAVLGVVALVFVRHRFLALIAPFLVYFVETVVAALAGSPHAALAYSVFPFGLTQAPIPVSSIPVLATAVLAVAGAAVALRRSPRLEALA